MNAGVDVYAPFPLTETAELVNTRLPGEHDASFRYTYQVIEPVGLVPPVRVAVSVAELGEKPRVIEEGDTEVVMLGTVRPTLRISPLAPHAFMAPLLLPSPE